MVGIQLVQFHCEQQRSNMDDFAMIATLATIGALCLLAISILLILLVLRSVRTSKNEDVESCQDSQAKSHFLNESVVVIKDQSYYCMIGSSASFCSSSDTDTDTSTSSEDHREDTESHTETSEDEIVTSSEELRAETETSDDEAANTIEDFKPVDDLIEDLKCRTNNDTATEDSSELEESSLNSSLTSLYISQLFKDEMPKQSDGKLEENRREYIFESVDIKTNRSEISFVNIENAIEADLFIQKGKCLMSPQARRDLEIIEKNIFRKSENNSLTAWGLLNRFSYFYCLGLDMKSQY